MIDFREHRDAILGFLESGLAEFRQENRAGLIGHAALYCCPWSGWVSLCLHPVAQLHQNCPDFEHVEVALYQAPTWSEEYENGDPLRVITLGGDLVTVDLASEGDEAMNSVFSAFLRELLANPRAIAALKAAAGSRLRVGVQLLDSEFNDSWQVA